MCPQRPPGFTLGKPRNVLRELPSHQLGERVELDIFAAHAAAERSQHRPQLEREAIGSGGDVLAVGPRLGECEQFVVEPEPLAIERGRTLADLAIAVRQEPGIERLVLDAGVLAQRPDEGGLTPEERLRRIRERLHRFAEAQDACWNEQILPALKTAKIHLRKWKQLSEEDRLFAARFYHDQVDPLLTPVTIDPSHRVWLGNFGFEGKGCETEANHYTASSFSLSGKTLSPPGGWEVGGINWPQATVTDQQGSIWLANCGSGSVTKCDRAPLLNAISSHWMELIA